MRFGLRHIVIRRGCGYKIWNLKRSSAPESVAALQVPFTALLLVESAQELNQSDKASARVVNLPFTHCAVGQFRCCCFYGWCAATRPSHDGRNLIGVQWLQHFILEEGRWHWKGSMTFHLNLSNLVTNTRKNSGTDEQHTKKSRAVSHPEWNRWHFLWQAGILQSGSTTLLQPPNKCTYSKWVAQYVSSPPAQQLTSHETRGGTGSGGVKRRGGNGGTWRDAQQAKELC